MLPKRACASNTNGNLLTRLPKVYEGCSKKAIRMGLTLKEKQAVPREYRPRYQKTSKKEPQALRDEYIRLTGYHRKSALRVVRGKPVTLQPEKKRQANRTGKGVYDHEVIASLRLIWTFFWYQCIRKRSFRKYSRPSCGSKGRNLKHPVPGKSTRSDWSPPPLRTGPFRPLCLHPDCHGHRLRLDVPVFPPPQGPLRVRSRPGRTSKPLSRSPSWSPTPITAANSATASPKSAVKRNMSPSPAQETIRKTTTACGPLVRVEQKNGSVVRE
jgi:hypothetical protein